MFHKPYLIIFQSLFLLIISTHAMAIGLGGYINGEVGEFTLKETYKGGSIPPYVFHEKFHGMNYAFGTGFLLDTCVAEDRLFNYRLHIGVDDYSYPEAPFFLYPWHKNDYALLRTMRTSLKNTFGFGVFRNNVVRLWVGPSLSIYYYPSLASRLLYNDFHLLIPGLAVGTNIHLNHLISLSIECGADYDLSIPHSHQDHFTAINGYINLGILFRINDSYKK